MNSFFKAGFTISSILAISLLSGCNKDNRKDSADICYSLDRTSPACVDSLFSDVDILELQFDGEHYPSSVSALNVCDRYVFIEDNNQCIYIFNSKGQYLSSSIERLGSGPGEFVQSMGWSWNPYSERMEILTPDKIMFYDANFNHLEDCPLPPSSETGTLYDRIFDTSATIHYLLPTGVSEDPYRIVRFDSHLGEVTAQCTYDADVIAPISMQQQCFFTTPEKEVLFAPPAVTYSIYAVADNGNDINKAIALTPGNGWMESNGPTKLSPAELMTSSDIIPLKTFVTPNQILIMTKSGMTLSDMDYFSIDRNNGSVMRFKLYNNGSYTFPPINYVDENYAYAAMERGSLDEAPGLIPANSKEAISTIADADSESLLLLRYHMR